jgi:hypothetical protein
MWGSDSPFIGTEALANGLATKRTLHSRYNMVHRNVYVRKGQALDAAARARAAWLWSGRNATVAGLSAAALHGSKWIPAELPAELIRTEASDDERIVVHRTRLRADEACVLEGVEVTTPARTAFGLGRRKGLTTALIRVDALANATRLMPAEVDELAIRHRGTRGVVQLREVVSLMDGGAESPQETRTRLLLVRAGLPKPTTQIVVLDDFGIQFARIDMGFEDCLVGVEYDGPQHWTDPARRTADIDRYAELTAKGWRIVRVSSELLRYRPHVVVARVCDALQAADCPWLAECGVDPRYLQKSVA